jgi:hypothetical protein
MKWLIFLLIIGCQAGFYQKKKFADPKPTKICFLGDVGKASYVQGQVAEALKSEKCHEIFFTGDIIYPGGIHSISDKNVERKFLHYYRPLTVVDNKPHLHIALGNHDYGGNADIWSEISHFEPSIYAPARYFFEDYEGICLITLDTDPLRFSYQKLRNQGQIDWLNQQRKKIKNCKLSIAIAHHPYHNAFTKRGPAKGAIKTFLETYVLGQFNYYIAGHNHFMQYDGIDKGTIQYTTGAGGWPEEGQLPGYLTMTIENTAQGLKVLTSIKKLTGEGKTIHEDQLNSF